MPSAHPTFGSMLQMTPKEIDVGHSKLAYWRQGSGPDLVLIHGWPLHSGTFRNLLPKLSERFTCHLIDLPGAGRTRVFDPSKIDMRAHVDTVLHAIDQLGLAHYALLAQDSGAVIARYVAIRRPKQVWALVMGNTEIPHRHSRLFRAFVTLGSSRAGRALIGLTLTWQPLQKILLSTCFHDPSRREAEFDRGFFALKAAPDALRQSLKLLDGFDIAFTDQLAHEDIRATVQLIWGAGDPFFLLRDAERMQAEFSGGCELEVLRPAKLLAHEEHPDQFAELARDFLLRNAHSMKEVCKASA